MHLIESQATQVGQYIDKVSIYERYFPLPFTNSYIVFAPHSKESKTYDYWNDVLSILLPILNAHNIKIIQIGATNERPYNGCYYLCGQTNINQTAFLIRNSIAVLSTDTFAQHLADAYAKKSLVLISNNYSHNVRGYFNPQLQIVLEPSRLEHERPCLSLQEIPKSINRIPIEDIAEQFCKLLNLEYNWSYKTLYLGNISIASMLISACDQLINPNQFGTNHLIMDMSLNFNEDILLQQAQICTVSIITNKILSDKIFNFQKQTKRIKEIIYIIDEHNSPDFARNIMQSGTPLRLISKLPIEQINELKFKYMEIGVIWPIDHINPQNMEQFKNIDLNNVFFKSSKFYLGRNKLYPSKSHYLIDKNIQGFDEITEILDNQEFWDELESFKFFVKKG